jgi:hypothetical protein
MKAFLDLVINKGLISLLNTKRLLVSQKVRVHGRSGQTAVENPVGNVWNPREGSHAEKRLYKALHFL